MNKNCFAQDNTFEVKGLHTVYVEVYGNAFEGYTIGYDYALKLREKHKLSFNCGFGYVPDLDNFFNFSIFPLQLKSAIYMEKSTILNWAWGNM